MQHTPLPAGESRNETSDGSNSSRARFSLSGDSVVGQPHRLCPRLARRMRAAPNLASPALRRHLLHRQPRASCPRLLPARAFQEWQPDELAGLAFSVWPALLSFFLLVAQRLPLLGSYGVRVHRRFPRGLAGGERPGYVRAAVLCLFARLRLATGGAGGRSALLTGRGVCYGLRRRAMTPWRQLPPQNRLKWSDQTEQ